VFATSCPFKTLTSAGEPLVQELDSIIDQWGLANADAEADTTPHIKQDQSASLKADTTPHIKQDLSASLKAGTKTVHRAAENCAS